MMVSVVRLIWGNMIHIVMRKEWPQRTSIKEYTVQTADH